MSSEAKVEEGKKEETEEEGEAEREEQVPEEPLEKSVLDNFTDVMLPGKDHDLLHVTGGM